MGQGSWLGGWVCYLVPRSGVAVTEIWAAVALGWRWSFTVCQPGLGIVTRVSMGRLKGGREARKEGWRRAKQRREEANEGGGVGRRCGGIGWTVQRSRLMCKSGSFIFFPIKRDRINAGRTRLQRG